MHNTMNRLLLAMFAAATLSLSASATVVPPGDVAVPVGFVSYDVTGANVAEFDITNLTGANSSSPGDPSFPVTTPVSFTNLNLVVDFADGNSETFGSSYFTLGGDGFSFSGNQLSTLSGDPTGLSGAISATLTGDFSTTVFALNNASIYGKVVQGFSAEISDPSGLQDGDLAVIDAASPVPEPSTWMLMATGMIGFFGLTATRRLKRRHVGYALGACCALLLLPAAHASNAVKLSTATSPSSGTAGTGSVSVTGSGFPSGTITPATVNVSLAATCGGTATPATVTSVQTVLGSEDKITFVLPGSLTAGNYFVSVSGSSSTASFSSSNCSTVQVLPGASPTLSIDTSKGATDWVIKNGALTIDYNATEGNIWSIVPTGTQDQLIDFEIPDAANGEAKNTGTFNSGNPLSGIPQPAGWSSANPVGGSESTLGVSTTYEPTGFYSINSGFTAVTPVPHYVQTPSYIDFWTAYPASGVATKNTTEYEEHFVVTPNDPGIHLYLSLNHPAQVAGTGGTLVSNGAGTIGGQVQWVIRNNTLQFKNLYAKNADLSMVNGVITPAPTEDDCFSADLGRSDQDATGLDTIDLHPQVGVENAFSHYPDPASGIPEGFHRHYCVKYDYSSYEYMHQAQGMFGAKYGDWIVFTAGHDTFIDGPEKQNLNFTTPTLITIEPNSNHYRTGGVGTTSIAAGTAASRLYGPFYVRINHFGMATESSIDGGVIQTPDDMFNDAVAAGSSFTDFYNNESVLLASGYVPTTARGSVSIQVGGVTGASRTAWAVLSQPGVNQQLTTAGYEYWADISSSGSTTFTNVVPGTYRLSVWDFGQWGEYRQDNVVVTAGNTTTVPGITFIPENFGTVVGTIGTPDRSSHEFLHGSYAQDFADGPKGYDDREYYGAWNYWADWANSPVPGAPVYNLTDGPGYTATNNPLAWNYAHWGGFDPGLYGGTCVATDDTTDAYKDTGCTSLGDTIGIPAYVNTLAGHAGTNGISTPTPPWQIHFATPSGASSQAYVVLSLALADSQGKETVSLNGNALSYTPPSTFNSDAVERSGLTGYTQWVAFQWPTSLLAAAGADNVITTSVSGVNSQDADDALRLELTNISASPSSTGWHDYYFVTSGTTTTSNDAVPNP